MQKNWQDYQVIYERRLYREASDHEEEKDREAIPAEGFHGTDNEGEREG